MRHEIRSSNRTARFWPGAFSLRNSSRVSSRQWLGCYGCHHNRKPGGYHCHRGALARQSFSQDEGLKKVSPEKIENDKNKKKKEKPWNSFKAEADGSINR